MEKAIENMFEECPVEIEVLKEKTQPLKSCFKAEEDPESPRMLSFPIKMPEVTF